MELTVKELIDILSRFDKDKSVFIGVSDIYGMNFDVVSRSFLVINEDDRIVLSI